MLPINRNLLKLDAEAQTAEEAIRIAGELLLTEGKIESSYIDAMVRAYKEVGPYIVIAPMIAVPHARPEHGVKEKCVSIVRLKSPVLFGHPENDPVTIVCAIGGTDDVGHIEVLQSLSTVLGDEAKFEKLLRTESLEEFMTIVM
jgi:mannitol/fructose-specific phosphotransferase system IIA component (Ntr-type)